MRFNAPKNTTWLISALLIALGIFLRLVNIPVASPVEGLKSKTQASVRTKTFHLWPGSLGCCCRVSSLLPWPTNFRLGQPGPQLCKPVP